MVRQMKIRKFTFLFCFIVVSIVAHAQPSHVEVITRGDGFELLRDGEPYYIKGAGAKSHFELLDNSGANSIRLWSTNKENLLDSALEYGMTVSLGLHIRPERNGMDYNDEYAVQGQIEQLKQEVLRYKDHPALLVWGIGNEVDLKYTNFKVWHTIEAIAKFIKEVDPHHPTMTVIAGLDPSKAYLIKTHCPSVDILGVNAYGSIENLHRNVRRFNWDKPYIVTEWGVNGPFEAQTTSWKAKIEPPGGVKAEQRRRRYQNLIAKDTERCLGSYCFLWGQKQESTATWHGMFLSNGRPTEAVDMMQYCWTGTWPEHRAPSIQNIALEKISWKKDHILTAGSVVRLSIDYESYGNDELTIEIQLFPESFSKKIGGDIQKVPEQLEVTILTQDDEHVTFETPRSKGAYRIFVRVINKYHQCSVANIPFLVE